MESRTKTASRLIILILGALYTVSPFSIDMYLPAFKQIAQDLGTTVPKVSLTLSTYFIGLALGQILYGPLLDRFGRKKPLYIGLFIYVACSLGCFFTTHINGFIGFRLFQALGACAAQVGAVTMVRDFFSPKENAKIFSLLMLILSVSPLFAPTVGSVIAVEWGWRSIFLLLAIIVTGIALMVRFGLPPARPADASVSLDIRAILKTFRRILAEPQFFVYAVCGAFSFAGLFVYVAGAPSLFIDTFRLSEKTFGILFAFLSVGVVGGGQFNIWLGRRFSTEAIFKTAMTCQTITSALLLVGTLCHWFDFTFYIVLFVVFLSSVGLTYPNAAAKALAPFENNVGSAAALLGFLQMGIGAISSAAFGLLGFRPALSMSILFLATGLVGSLILKFRPIREWASA